MRKFIKYLIFLTICYLIQQSVTAQTRMEITLDKEAYMPGDTLTFNCEIPAWLNTKKIGTLNLWIEDVHHAMIWKLRYPVLAGLCEANLILPPNFPADQYAFYFQLQDDFFSVKGEMDYKFRGDSVSYTLMLDNTDLVAGRTYVTEQGTFRLPRHVFGGQAVLFVSEIGKRNRIKSDIAMKVTTPLDSAFVPLADTLISVKIGQIETGIAAEEYRLNREVFSGNKRGTLQDVEIVGKIKTPVEKFDEEIASGFFRGSDAQIFDGLDNQFAGFINILDYLQGRVAGLRILPGGSFGSYDVQWRGQATAFFLDEMPVDVQTLGIITVNDIAMVKVFRPPFMGAFLGGGGGAIAIYTKRGGSGSTTQNKSRFVINGYTPLEYVLNPFKD